MRMPRTYEGVFEKAVIEKRDMMLLNFCCVESIKRHLRV